MPGNHEVRWDPTAKGLYREQFGAVPYSFDAGGVHVAGFDPTQSLLEPGHCGAAALEWLDRDLAAAAGPALLFQHFPVGGEHDYVDDQAALLELIARHDVRVLVAGHVHRETVTRLDGPVQVTLQAVLKEPVFYWAELGVGPALTVSRVAVAADGTRAGSPVVTVPLTGPLTGGAGSPGRDSAAAAGSDRGLRPPAAVAAGLPRPPSRLRVTRSVQAGIAVVGDAVVTTSTSGDVAAIPITAARRIGAFPGGGGRGSDQSPAAGRRRDGRTLFVSSADGHLYVGHRHRTRRLAVRRRRPGARPAPGHAEFVVLTAGERLLAVTRRAGNCLDRARPRLLRRTGRV